MRVCEIFYSIQGEGRYAGRHSLFIRFGGCNLRCEGFGDGCDSRYSVDPSFKESWMNFDAKSLAKECEKIRKYRYADTVLTGGEPTLYFNDRQFREFAAYLTTLGSLVTVETNATREIDFSFEPFSSFIYALSVKLSNSDESFENRVNPIAISSYIKNSNHFFKFVLDANFIASGGAKRELEGLMQEFEIAPQNIYCMPMGASKEEIAANAKATFEFCLSYGYQYSDRLHIRVYDKKRGV